MRKKEREEPKAWLRESSPFYHPVGHFTDDARGYYVPLSYYTSEYMPMAASVGPIPLSPPLHFDEDNGEELYEKAMAERRKGRIDAGVLALKTLHLSATGYADLMGIPGGVEELVLTILDAADKWEESWD